MQNPLIVKNLGLADYQTIWEKMKAFTDARETDTIDEVWTLQHKPVYTLGQAGKAEHILNTPTIPLVHSDRGGQVTYHGPGQLIVYTLFDLNRLKIGTRQLVGKLEQTVVSLLETYAINAQTRCDAPGVYIDGAKICSIGLRVRRGCSYHGIALNVAMDITPFSHINPCGYQGLAMTQLSQYVANITVSEVATKIIQHLISNFGYNHYNYLNPNLSDR